MRLRLIMIFVLIWEKNKGDCDREMVKSLDGIPYAEMRKWGQAARLLQKLGLGLRSKTVNRR